MEHVLRRDSDDLFIRALDLEVVRKRKHWGPNVTWRRQEEEQIEQIGFKKQDAIDRTKWRNRVYELSSSMR